MKILRWDAGRLVDLDVWPLMHHASASSVPLVGKRAAAISIQHFVERRGQLVCLTAHTVYEEPTSELHVSPSCRAFRRVAMSEESPTMPRRVGNLTMIRKSYE